MWGGQGAPAEGHPHGGERWIKVKLFQDIFYSFQV